MYYDIYQRYEEISKQSNVKDAFKTVCEEYGLSETDMNEILQEAEE